MERKKVDLKKLENVKPQEIKNDPILSKIWEELTYEAKRKNMLYKP